ncbi:MAG: prenyltransferase/squalene oxidase repeat-containing protein [Syntrophales bacterium]|nr:prenyltransferase/squalene oxidase repeat-containing protein [Syntrophales bacterium]
MKTNKVNTANIYRTALQLSRFIGSALKGEKEVKRIALCALSLVYAGVHPKGDLFSMAARYIADRQQEDGGWSDVEETVLSVKTISLLGRGKYDPSVERGKIWLRCQQNPDGGWGRSIRDISRIPVTGFLLYLLPGISDSKTVSWLRDEWRKDFGCDVKLTYKGSFFLLGLSAFGVPANDCPLIGETYAYLHEEQNDNGGFAPWKDHPIGSDPWSTGVVLLGLLSYPELVKRAVIEKTANWLTETQLPNGLWPCHYLEEGSSYAYWGLVEAIKYLSKDLD